MNTDSIDPSILDDIIRHLSQARRILFITGAGISADSGLSTYRGQGGLYNDTVTDEGFPIEEAVSGPMFQRRPEITWKYLSMMAESSQGATFNDGHRVIADMEHSPDTGEVCVLTQNVDGFHRAAGSSNVIEIHGNSRELHCTACSWETGIESYREIKKIPPRCPDCNAIIRPRVVLFEEMLPEAALDHLFAEMKRGFDMVFSIGTSALFPYIVQPVVEAARQGKPTVEINPAETDLSGLVDYRLPCGARNALTTLWRRHQAKS